MTMVDDARLAAALAETRVAYDAVPPLQAELEALGALPQVQADYDAALAGGSALLAALNEQLANLRRAERQLTSQAGAPLRPPVRPVRVVRYEQEGSLPPDVVAPAAPTAPRVDPARLRGEVKQVATRFARQRLNAKDPGILAAFNFLARDPEAPPGKLLAVLDWEVVFAAPLHERETAAEQVERLERWRLALHDYGERLRGDIRARTRQHQAILPLRLAWEARRDGSPQWAELIAAAQAAQAQEAAALQQQVAAALARIEALRRETGPAETGQAETGQAGAGESQAGAPAAARPQPAQQQPGPQEEAQ
jgi:hypothetical protein